MLVCTRKEYVLVYHAFKMEMVRTADTAERLDHGFPGREHAPIISMRVRPGGGWDYFVDPGALSWAVVIWRKRLEELFG